MIREITAQELNSENFIRGKVHEIKHVVGDGMAINALSGGVDSSTVTMLGHRALGPRLKTVFIENGLMREGESEQVANLFRKLGGQLLKPKTGPERPPPRCFLFIPRPGYGGRKNL